MAATLRDDVRFIVLVTAAALALRLLYALTAASIDWPDTFTYWQAGRDLREGRLMSSHLAMPLYPLFFTVAGWHRVLPLQWVLSALCVPLVYAVAREIFPRRAVARWAAALMAIEPLSIFFANQRLTETLFTFLVCLALLALYRRQLLVASIVLAVSILVRPTLDLVAPLLVVVFSLRGATDRKAGRAARALGLYVLVYAIVMAPWWIHNERKYDRFVRLNLGDGIVLRVEHNPLFVRWGFWSHLKPIFEEFADEPDPIRRNLLRREAAIGFIVEDPLRYLGLCVRRLGRFWTPILGQTEDTFLSQPAQDAFFVANVVILGGIAAFALQCRRRRWREVAPLLLVIGYVTAVHVAMHSLVRYRAPVMPLVAVVAAVGWERITRRSMRVAPVLPGGDLV